MGNSVELDFYIHGYKKISFFGAEVYITTSHVCLGIVMAIMLIFGICARIAVKKADPTKAPKGFLNLVELIVEKLDGLLIDTMGEKLGRKFANYVGTIFILLIICNLSGLLGLRPPTADFGITLPIALITFGIIQYQGFKAQKFGKIKGLFEPIFLFFPINLISEISTPLSMSLRLFGNVLSGTIIMALIYGLLPKFILVAWPAALHAYFDVFAGALQAYVFCVLTMVFTKNAVED